MVLVKIFQVELLVKDEITFSLFLVIGSFEAQITFSPPIKKRKKDYLFPNNICHSAPLHLAPDPARQVEKERLKKEY